MNLIYVFEHGDIILIATFLLLICMSITSWYVIFWKILVMRAERRRLRYFKERYVTSQDWPKRAANMDDVKGSIAILLQEVRKTSPIIKGADENTRRHLLTTHLSQGLDSIRVKMDRGLTVLASVGSSAPFVGLFGTVWGIYGALMDIAAESSASLSIVAGPMGEALTATAAGLFAAIPAVLAYNAFIRINRITIQELRHISEQITLYHEEE